MSAGRWSNLPTSSSIRSWQLIGMLWATVLAGLWLPAGAGGEVGVVAVDDEWLAKSGKGPHLLDRPDTEYRLETDVRTEGSGFVVGAAGVVLDLNGHELVFGDVEPPAVANPGFEEGASGWDLSAAPNASVVPNRSFLFGEKVLRLSGITKKQRVRSAPVPIADREHLYAAMITPAARPHWKTKLIIEVRDADSGDLLEYFEERKDETRPARGESRNPERGFAAVAYFEPHRTGTSSVVVEITVIPAGGSDVTIDLDDLRILPAQHFGVVATARWAGEIRSAYEWSADARKAYRRAADVMVRNGAIRNGRAGGLGDAAMLFDGIPGFRVANVRAHMSGADVYGVRAKGVEGHAVVQDSSFSHTDTTISNRMDLVSTINVSGDAAIVIERNLLDAVPQVGVFARNGQAYELLIKGNKIHPTATVTNAYGILIEGAQNFQILDNEIKAVSGRGILIDGFSKNATENGLIQGNHVEVSEPPNREYITGAKARALRMRNNVDAEGPHRNIRVVDNHFIAHTGRGAAREAYAGRVTYVDERGAMKGAEIVFENNRFTAVTRDASHEATALVVNGSPEGFRLTFRNNVFESNNRSLRLAEDGGGHTSGVRFIANEFKRLADPNIGYESIRIGWGRGRWARDVTDVSLIDSVFTNGASNQIQWEGEGEIEVQVSTKAEPGAASPHDDAAVVTEVYSRSRGSTRVRMRTSQVSSPAQRGRVAGIGATPVR